MNLIRDMTEEEKCLIGAFISHAGGHVNATVICINHAEAAKKVNDTKRELAWKMIWNWIRDEQIRIGKL